jgi:hypothetical protein
MRLVLLGEGCGEMLLCDGLKDARYVASVGNYRRVYVSGWTICAVLSSTREGSLPEPMTQSPLKLAVYVCESVCWTAVSLANAILTSWPNRARFVFESLLQRHVCHELHVSILPNRPMRTLATVVYNAIQRVVLEMS